MADRPEDYLDGRMNNYDLRKPASAGVGATALWNEIEAGLKGVAPGPWRATFEGNGVVLGYAGGFQVHRDIIGASANATAAHIARCSPDNMTTLLADRNALLKALSKTISAWEALPGGDYAPSVVAKWLLDTMKPQIDALRAALHDQAPA